MSNKKEHDTSEKLDLWRPKRVKMPITKYLTAKTEKTDERTAEDIRKVLEITKRLDRSQSQSNDLSDINLSRFKMEPLPRAGDKIGKDIITDMFGRKPNFGIPDPLSSIIIRPDEHQISPEERLEKFSINLNESDTSKEHETDITD